MARGRWARDLGLERRWRGILAAFGRSGLSVRAFCRARSISEPSFYSWRRELARRDRVVAKSAMPAFVPVTVVPSAVIEVVLPSGVMVRVPTGADETHAVRLIRGLTAEASAC